VLLPELAERDATGRSKEIYEEMKRLGAVPMPALIFRHLATVPGALEWLWDAVCPAWRTGRVQEAAWRIAREAQLDPIAKLHRPALRALGVDGEGEREVRIVLRSYNLANPENMLTILCALRLLRGSQPPPGTLPGEGQAPWSPPPAPGPLVPMIDVKTMPREVSEVLDLVAAPGEAGGPRVVQSLYRHFGHRPAFLAAVVTLLRQRLDDGSVGRAVDGIHARMSREADAVVRMLTAPPCPQPVIEGVCRRFSGSVIPQMIVAGRLLEDALPD
jgi:hypothetical protein